MVLNLAHPLELEYLAGLVRKYYEHYQQAQPFLPVLVDNLSTLENSNKALEEFSKCKILNGEELKRHQDSPPNLNDKPGEASQYLFCHILQWTGKARV